MELELPGVGELVKDQPGAEVGPGEREVALDPGDVRLDGVQSSAGPGAPRRSVLRGKDRVVLAEHAPRHQAEQLTDVPVEHAPADAGRDNSGTVARIRSTGARQALHHREVGVDEPATVERDEARIGVERPADLGQERRDRAALS